MTSILANAVDLAFQSAALVAGVEIVYTRGELSATITAIAGSQTIQTVTEFENLIQRRWREQFLVAPADLADFGEPAPGDKIQLSPAGRPDITLTFTLRPEDAGQPCFRPTDRFHSRWRLNTILTGKDE
jgi:hypothetical protein